MLRAILIVKVFKCSLCFTVWFRGKQKEHRKLPSTDKLISEICNLLVKSFALMQSHYSMCVYSKQLSKATLKVPKHTKVMRDTNEWYMAIERMYEFGEPSKTRLPFEKKDGR
jgi:hypothetical protein